MIRLVPRVICSFLLAFGLLMAPTFAANLSSQINLDRAYAQGAAGATGRTSAEGVAAFLTPGGLLPPCLRTADEAQKAGISCVEESIAHYTSILLFLIAVGAFLYFLYGAFLYASAFGDENKVTQAKGIIKYAVIGIVLAILSATIVEILKGLLGFTG